MILIDSNVLIDLLGTQQDWYEWSRDAVERAADDNQLAINIVSIAEVAPRLGSLRAFLDALAVIGADVLEMNNEAAFHAGVAFDAFRARRRSGDDRQRTVLPDFFIGGHAQAEGAGILTRDPRFYRHYFPDVSLITPDTDQ